MNIDNMLFYAPAFMSRGIRHTIRFISGLFPNLRTPVSEGDFNYNTYLKAKYYRPLADATDVLHRYGTRKANINSLLVVKEHDKISKVSKLEEMIDDGLSNWKLHIVERSNWLTEDRDQGHLITLREYLDYPRWYTMNEQISEFLGQ